MGLLTPIFNFLCLLPLQLPNFGATSILPPRRPWCIAGSVSHRPCCHAGPAAMQSTLPHRPCCLVDHSALPAACHASHVTMPAPLPRSPRCHANPAAWLTTVPSGHVLCRLCCHASPTTTQSALPCQPCCLADQSAPPVACCAGRVATPVPLPHSLRGHAIRPARSS
jgi:hypothetical protein